MRLNNKNTYCTIRKKETYIWKKKSIVQKKKKTLKEDNNFEW